MKPYVGSGFSRTILLLSVLIVAEQPAAAQDPLVAQQPPERPVALDPAAALAKGSWTLTMSGFGGHDRARSDRYALELPGLADMQITQSGTNAGGSARFSASRITRWSGLSFVGDSTSVRYSLARKWFTDANVAFGESATLGKRTTVSAAQTFGYAPYYSVGVFPGLGNIGGTDLASAFIPTFDSGIYATPTYRYGLTAQLVHPFTDRTQFSVTYSNQGTRVSDVAASSNLETVGGRLSHQINRPLGFHAGYTVDTFHYRFADTRLHNIDAGLDLRKAFSLTRRTTFSFSTGSTILKRDPSAAGAIGRSQGTEFRLLGSATLSHYIGRTWSARAAYSRDAQLLQGSGTPFLSDGLTAALGGNLSPRLSAGLSASYVIGSGYATAISEKRDRAAFASAWLQTTLARHLTAYAQYAYYRQKFSFDDLPLDLPQRFRRNSVRVGLTLTVPRR